jgi:hypothetical protein
MTVIIVNETMRIDNTQSVEVSDIEDDGDTGGFVRRVEFFTDAAERLNRRPVLTVMIYAEVELPLKLTIPTGVKF